MLRSCRRSADPTARLARDVPARRPEAGRPASSSSATWPSTCSSARAAALETGTDVRACDLRAGRLSGDYCSLAWPTRCAGDTDRGRRPGCHRARARRGRSRRRRDHAAFRAWPVRAPPGSRFLSVRAANAASSRTAAPRTAWTQRTCSQRGSTAPRRCTCRRIRCSVSPWVRPVGGRSSLHEPPALSSAWTWLRSRR